MSLTSFLLSNDFCLQSHVSCTFTMFLVFFLLSPVSLLMFYISCLNFPVSWITSLPSNLLSYISWVSLFCLLSPLSCVLSHILGLLYCLLLTHVPCLMYLVSLLQSYIFNSIFFFTNKWHLHLDFPVQVGSEIVPGATLTVANISALLRNIERVPETQSRM